MPLADQRFEVSLDAFEFRRFTATVGCDADESPFAGAGGEHWEEHLLIERILQAVVLDEVINLHTFARIIAQVVEPVHELVVGDMVEKSRIDVECPVAVTEQKIRFETRCLVAGV